MIDRDILEIAMRQSAEDQCCSPADFTAAENIVVRSKKNDKARICFELPHICNMVSYGSNVVASVGEGYEDIVRDYLARTDAMHCFETPSIYLLNRAFEPFGAAVCFMAEYWLPDGTDKVRANSLKEQPCRYELRVLHKDDFAELYKPEWSNALCEKRSFADMLAVGAYDGGELVGLAGCSADYEEMWQIGVDVLPGYRQCGIASALTSRLALLILDEGKVPFYCCAWCNIRSARNAIKSGFRPAWNELSVKSLEYIKDIR